MLHITANEWFAARDPQCPRAERHQLARHQGKLFKSEQLCAREEGEVGAEDLRWHAVAAAEVAAIGDGEAHVTQRPPTLVKQRYVSEWEVRG